MGTKNNPGKFDCYTNALPDEPIFVLLARDPNFNKLVRKWSEYRIYDINIGERPSSDMDMVTEAQECAFMGMNWRRDNYGIWRKK